MLPRAIASSAFAALAPAEGAFFQPPAEAFNSGSTDKSSCSVPACMGVLRSDQGVQPEKAKGGVSQTTLSKVCGVLPIVCRRGAPRNPTPLPRQALPKAVASAAVLLVSP